MLTFSRYIDDLFKIQCTSVDTSYDFKSILYLNEESNGIYPSKLVDSEGTITTDPLKLAGEMGQTCNFLGATILIDPKLNRVTWTLYNKRVDMKIGETAMSELRYFLIFHIGTQCFQKHENWVLSHLKCFGSTESVSKRGISSKKLPSITAN